MVGLATKIIAVGKISKKDSEYSLFAEYAKRLQIPFTLHEIANQQTSAVEGENIVPLLAKNSYIVCLDERGKQFNSQEFAKFLANIATKYASITFVIGGADGHSSLIRQRANFLLSLGNMTWPHKLARVMLIEQLYRAQTILSNHPYHR